MSNDDLPIEVLVDPDNRDESGSWVPLDTFQNERGNNLLLNSDKMRAFDKETGEFFEFRYVRDN